MVSTPSVFKAATNFPMPLKSRPPTWISSPFGVTPPVMTTFGRTSSFVAALYSARVIAAPALGPWITCLSSPFTNGPAALLVQKDSCVFCACPYGVGDLTSNHHRSSTVSIRIADTLDYSYSPLRSYPHVSPLTRECSEPVDLALCGLRILPSQRKGDLLDLFYLLVIRCADCSFEVGKSEFVVLWCDISEVLRNF